MLACCVDGRLVTVLLMVAVVLVWLTNHVIVTNLSWPPAKHDRPCQMPQNNNTCMLHNRTRAGQKHIVIGDDKVKVRKTTVRRGSPCLYRANGMQRKPVHTPDHKCHNRAL